MRTSTPPAQRPPWNEKWKSSGCRSRKISISQKTPGFHQIPNLETSLVYTKYDHHRIASVSKSDQRLKPTFWLSSQNLGPWKMDAVLNQRIFRLNTITFKTNLTYKKMLKTTRVESQKRPCGRFRGLIPISFILLLWFLVDLFSLHLQGKAISQNDPSGFSAPMTSQVLPVAGKGSPPRDNWSGLMVNFIDQDRWVGIGFTTKLNHKET